MKSMEGKGENEFCRNSNDGSNRQEQKNPQTGRKIWEFREVGWEEFNSSALLMDELEKEGFEVQRGLVGKHPKFDHKIDMPTAFKAVFKGKRRRPCHWYHA